MADKLMYIPNEDTQNYPFYELKLMVKTFEHSTEPTNQNSQNAPKMSILRIRKRYYKTLGTCPLSL